eukprot:m.38505 g.38505  ORF g.38505 m.38505 type:complete len:416 (+) comp9442_c1_seq1:2075-3322(+)
MEPTTTTTTTSTTTTETTTTSTTTTTLEPTTTTSLKPSTTTLPPTTTTTPVPTTYKTPLASEGWTFSETTGCYYTLPDTRKMIYDEAKQYCALSYIADDLENVHLATVSSEYEARLIADFLEGPGNPKWVGIELTPRGEFRNIDGTYFSTSLFYDGEPSARPPHPQLQLGYRKASDDTHPYKLNDAHSGNKNRFVCEWCDPMYFTTSTTMAPTTSTTSTTTTAAPTTTTTVTTTTTLEPTTTTTEVPKTPCPNRVVLTESDILVAHYQYLGETAARINTRTSGRSLPQKFSCEEYCKGLSWGPSCAPCAVSSLKTKETCLFPGPFFTGDLCHRDYKSGNITDIPCCNKVTDTSYLPDYDIAEATTCYRGKNCKCNNFGKVDKTDPQERLIEKFEASKLVMLPRQWTSDNECIELS